MKRLPNVHQRLLMALIVGVIAVPMTSTALFLDQKAVDGLDGQPLDLRQRAMEDRRRLRAERRSYWRAMEQYQRAEESGYDAVKPDINDATRQNNQEGEDEEALQPAAPVVTSLTTDQLLPQDKALLRRYTRAHSCPAVLKGFRVPGFYELCIALVGQDAKKDPVQGILGHNATFFGKLRGSAPDAVTGFKLRMQMLQQANDSTRRRDGGILPGRPTTCVHNPDCLEPRYSD